MSGRDRQVLRGISFTIGRGESYGLVGESGCGKSTVAQAAVRYLPGNGRIRQVEVSADGGDSWQPAMDGIDAPMPDMVELFVPAPDGTIHNSVVGSSL